MVEYISSLECHDCKTELKTEGVSEWAYCPECERRMLLDEWRQILE